MTTDKNPPLPAMAFRVGVTGHRRSRLSQDQLVRINRQFDDVLTMLAKAVSKAGNRFSNEYRQQDPILYFVSALADGADTLTAQKAVESGWRLLAPLPFSVEEYEADFSTADKTAFEDLLNRAYAVAELDGSRDGKANEERGYLQAGIVTVDQSDLLIAIWDGEEARGVGGTAMIKEEAMNAGKPVIWINAVSDEPILMLANGADHQEVTQGVLDDAISAIVAPPAASEIEHAYAGRATRELRAYNEYRGETAHHFNYGVFFQFWEKMFAGKWPFSTPLWCKSPRVQIEEMSTSTLAQKLQSSVQDQDVFNKLIIPRFAWADHLAVHYGNLYRSSYFFNYIFAAIAVFLALFDLVAGGMGFGNKTIWISAEVTIIVLILAVTTAGQKGRWHEKWIDYRQLAEELRQYRLYYLTLGRGIGDELTRGEAGEAAGWVDWYLAATRREAGMTSGSFATTEIKQIAEVLLEEEIRPQIAYHNKKAHMLHAMEHRLHHLGEYAFAATLIICLIYLSLAFLAGKEPGLPKWAYETKKDIKGIVTMMTGFLPALGAAFFGIRVQGEFGSTAERSHATASQLAVIDERFSALLKSERPRLDLLRVRIDEAARAMLMENADWRMLYISKPLNLPG